MIKEIFEFMDKGELSDALTSVMWQKVHNGAWNICTMKGEDGEPVCIIITDENGDKIMENLLRPLKRLAAAEKVIAEWKNHTHFGNSAFDEALIAYEKLKEDS